MLDNNCSISLEYGNPSAYRGHDLIVYYYGFEECKAEHYWTGVRDHYLIHYITSGRGTFTYNKETYSLKEGQGFLVCPNTLSYYKADKEQPWEYCWIGFHGNKAQYYLNQANLSLEQPIFSCPTIDTIPKLIQDMVDTKNTPRSRELVLIGLLYQFFAELIQYGNNPYTTPENQNYSKIYVNKAIDFIEKNYSRKITIEEIADYVGIDRKYLSSLFKDIIHSSPQNFLVNYRMNKACILLAENLLSITHVAHSVGYDDALLFSKMFKKYKGMSPTQYRKRLMREL